MSTQRYSVSPPPILPLSPLDGDVPAYDAFLAERRTLMATKIRDWFEVLR